MELPFLTVSSTIGTLSHSKNLMPFRPNFSSRVSGMERVVAGSDEQALITFSFGTEKGRREAIRRRNSLTASTPEAILTLLFGFVFWLITCRCFSSLWFFGTYALFHLHPEHPIKRNSLVEERVAQAPVDTQAHPNVSNKDIFGSFPPPLPCWSAFLGPSHFTSSDSGPHQQSFTCRSTGP